MRYLAVSGFLLILCGCGPREPYPVPVSGTVNLNGKPLAEGVVFFITPGKVPEQLDIKEGQFSGKVKWGQRRVEFAAYRPYRIPPEVPKSMHPLMQGGKENYLPQKYHRDSTLTVEVQETGENTFAFDLVSEAKD
jgi:hypothetical protein